MVAAVMLDMERVYFWLQFVAVAIGVATAIIVPLRKMITRYDDRLLQYDEKLAEYADDLEKSCQTSAGIQGAMLVITKMVLDDKIEVVLTAKEISNTQLENIEMIYQAYHDLNGNHGMQSKMQRIRHLPLKFSNSENGE